MNFAESCKEDLVYHGREKYLKIKKVNVTLFDRTIIDLGRRASKKWRRIVAGETSDCGTSDCAYCTQFYRPEKYKCKGCPIEFFTKKARCLASPYYDYTNRPTVLNAMVMKNFIDEIFIRSLLLIDWRKHYEMPIL